MQKTSIFSQNPIHLRHFIVLPFLTVVCYAYILMSAAKLSWIVSIQVIFVALIMVLALRKLYDLASLLFLGQLTIVFSDVVYQLDYWNEAVLPLVFLLVFFGGFVLGPLHWFGLVIFLNYTSIVIFKADVPPEDYQGLLATPIQAIVTVGALLLLLGYLRQSFMQQLSLLFGTMDDLKARIDAHSSELFEAHARAEIVAEISTALAQAPDEDSILAVVSELARPYGVSLVSLNFIHWDQAGDIHSVEVVALQNGAGEVLPVQTLPRHIFYGVEFPLMRLLYEKPNVPLIVEDVKTDLRMEQTQMRGLFQAVGVTSVIILPFRSGGRWQGQVMMAWREKQLFNPTLLSLLNAITPKLADVVANRRTYLAECEARRESDLLYQLSEAINATNAYETMVEAIGQWVDDPILDISLLIFEHFDQATATYAEEVAVMQQSELKMPGTRCDLDALVIPHKDAVIVENVETSQHLDATKRLFYRQRNMQAFIVTPVMLGDRLLGTLTFSCASRPRLFVPRQERLMRAVAGLVAGAIERGRLFAEARQARAAAEALHDIASVLNSTLDLDEVLEHILSTVGRVVSYDMAVMMMIEDDLTRTVGFRGEESAQAANVLRNLQFSVIENPYFRRIMQTHEPVIVIDTENDPLWVVIPDVSDYRSFVSVPIMFEHEVIGFLNLESKQPSFYSHAHAHRLQAFAHHASTAVQNARYYQQAQSVAVMQERQRIARELHDSVSQTLFSARTLAELLPRMHTTNPQKAEGYMRELEQLTRTAMAEMRTLLIELRPEALLQTELGVLIQQLCDTLEGNAQVPVVFNAASKVILPPEQQVVFYRIAQEAMNNIIKHAQATSVTVKLEIYDDTIELSIRDDGQGFILDQIPANHFGIKIMQERADSVDASLEIITAPHQGTQIVLRGAHQ